MAVPGFADWCAVDLGDGEGRLNRLSVAHIDPHKVKLGHELFKRYPPDPDAPSGIWQFIRSGKAENVSQLTSEMLEASVTDQVYLSILKSLGLRSYICAPLVVRGKVLGAVTFVSAESRRLYGIEEVALAEDISRRATIAVENENIYHKLQEAGRRKDDFLAMLAHELRNPLAPIRAASDLLKFPTGEAGFRKASEVIARQVDHMTELVDDLLAVSRVTRGLVQLEQKPVDFRSVASDAIEQVAPWLTSAGIGLHCWLVRMPCLFRRTKKDSCRP